MSLKERYYVVSWCAEYGIECCEDITSLHPDERAKKELLDTIKRGKKSDEKNPMSGMITAITMRARINSQRQYEVYVFTSAPEITLTDIESMFEADLQYFVDWVRKNHFQKLFDGRTTKKQVIH
mgnify:CR=1 FL=1